MMANRSDRGWGKPERCPGRNSPQSRVGPDPRKPSGPAVKKHRVNRPDTRLYLTQSLRRRENPCNAGAIHTRTSRIECPLSGVERKSIWNAATSVNSQDQTWRPVVRERKCRACGIGMGVPATVSIACMPLSRCCRFCCSPRWIPAQLFRPSSRDHDKWNRP